MMFRHFTEKVWNFVGIFAANSTVYGCVYTAENKCYVFLLLKGLEVCNFHDRYTSTLRDRILKQIQ